MEHKGCAYEQTKLVKVKPKEHRESLSLDSLKTQTTENTEENILSGLCAYSVNSVIKMRELGKLSDYLDSVKRAI